MHLATYKSGLDEIAWGIKRVRLTASLAHLFGSMAQRQLQETVNLPPSGFIGSSPIAPTIFGSIVKRISRNATDVVLKVRILLDPPFCPGDGIGIRIGLRSRVLRVRLPSWAPI